MSNSPNAETVGPWMRHPLRAGLFGAGLWGGVWGGWAHPQPPARNAAARAAPPATLPAAPSVVPSVAPPAAPPAAPPTGLYAGIGRAATPSELAAWDIDVRPDFKGLPPGRGSVAQGQVIWEAQCSGCHGIFGESNEVFMPLVGGTTARDSASGRVARLTDGAYPGRTTLMKLSTLSTLWDYIARAMPWNAPKTLRPEQVYAVTAYLLNLADVLPADFVLGHDNIAQVQQRLPNRHGMTTDHALWPGRRVALATERRAAQTAATGPHGALPDVRATACMSGCATEAAVASLLPDHARSAHGNLAEQNRSVGAQRGAQTAGAAAAGRAIAVSATATATTATATATATTPASASASTSASASASGAGASDAVSLPALAQKSQCLTCHAVDRKVLGPALRDIAQKYAGQPDTTALLTRKILEGGGGVWGAIPMPAQAIPVADAQALAAWVAAGAR